MRNLKWITVFICFTSFLLWPQVEASGQQKGEFETYIPIGLLVGKSNETEASSAALHAVELINDKGGVRGKKLKLIVRSVEGSWGAGSGKIVDLVFKDKVIAIVGSLDARNTHLAEQVIAKTQVPFLSAWASDPSLSNAYVSWFFSIVPNDEQQAEILLDEIHIDKKIQDLLVVYDGSYDSEQAYKSLMEKIKQFPELKTHPLRVQAQTDAVEVGAEIRKNRIQGILLLGRELPLEAIQEHIVNAEVDIPVFANLAVHGYSGLLDKKNFSMSFENAWISRREVGDLEYFNTRNDNGSIVGALTFDAVMALSSAMEFSEGDWDDLKKALSQVSYQGITGLIEFDALGRIKTSEE